MKQNNTYLAFGAILLLVAVLSFYLGGNLEQKENKDKMKGEESATTTQGTSSTSTTSPSSKKATTLSSGNTAGYLTYSNAEHGFILKYPSYVKTSQNFTSFHELGNNWRLNALPANQGKSVIEFIIWSVDQGVYSRGKETYPLYFTADVRVGISLNTKECYANGLGYATQKVTDVTINGVPFKKFSSSEGGTMKYTEAESYRTIRNKTCFVIEQIKSGSSYRDELMKTGTTDATLTSYYKTGETIIRTLTFTK